MNVIADSSSGDQLHHYVIRDSSGAAVLIEATDGQLTLHDDLNDGGVTGFGVVTNARPFGQQLVHARRVFQGAAPARGGWRSMDRFQRLALAAESASSALEPVEIGSERERRAPCAGHRRSIVAMVPQCQRKFTADWFSRLMMVDIKMNVNAHFLQLSQHLVFSSPLSDT